MLPNVQQYGFAQGSDLANISWRYDEDICMSRAAAVMTASLMNSEVLTPSLIAISLISSNRSLGVMSSKPNSEGV
ncbi:MAG: hypothetical protein WCR96_06800, partial [Candidatus Methanomethylophilaceae archaeon]